SKKMDREVKYIKLVMKGIYGVEMRSFKWEL
ncbi:hypothetical protein LCGC14_3060860, partial [marine sediment metagenome]